MKKTLTPLFFGAALLAGNAAFAKPAIYHDGQLSISQGAIFTNSRQDYYENIVLGADAEGKLEIVAATKIPLAYVDTADVLVDGDTATLVVSGNLPDPCRALQEPAVLREGNNFTVLIAAKSTLGDDMVCTTVLAPFELRVPFNINGLDAGTYKVTVNDVETSFILESETAPAS